MGKGLMPLLSTLQHSSTPDPKPLKTVGYLKITLLLLIVPFC